VHPEQANVCAAKNRLIREVYFSANKRTGTSRILCFSNREAQDTCAAHKSVYPVNDELINLCGQGIYSGRHEYCKQATQDSVP
jgi:hypothetical protein